MTLASHLLLPNRIMKTNGLAMLQVKIKATSLVKTMSPRKTYPKSLKTLLL